MRTTGSLILLLGMAAGSWAADTEVTEFQQRATALGQSINAADSPRSAHCAELQQTIQALRGRPQRRFSALEAYEMECQGGYQRSFGISPMDAGVPAFQGGFYR